MIQLEQTILRELIYHHIDIESNITAMSDEIYTWQTEDEMEVMKKIFVKPFSNVVTTNEFTHAINLELNTLFNLSRSIYQGGDFIGLSKQICLHLQSVSKHPNIKDGDLFVIRLDQVELNETMHSGLIICKVETKESFVETNSQHHNDAGISFRKGIGSRRLDKACLIVFSEEPYTLFVIDNAPIETDYWQHEFIKLSLKKDYVNHTSQFLTLTKTFVTDQFPEEFEITKADQIDLLNRSVSYFKSNDQFNKAAFEEEVLQDQGIIQSFRKYDEAYKKENDLDIEDEFSISSQAVKKQARIFKSVLKLDRNFHIYIHGNRDLIEQGQDSDGRKYYKIYFEYES